MAVQELDYRCTDTDRVAAATFTCGRKGKYVINFLVASQYIEVGVLQVNRDMWL